ncbi:MAG: large subunit ribosomal protein L4 [Pseudohongiellaceae bacterium]|jgi:large subunit ribosomal protein L4
MTEVTSWSDGKLGTADLDASSLGDKVKLRLMRDVVRMYEANKRQGTVKAKTRAETAYTENKPFKQKGTGNARRGDRNSPLLRGGGVIFGPRPRDYSFRVPRKALREALRSSLVGKLRDAEVQCLSSSDFSKPATKRAAQAMADLGCDGSAAIVIPSDNASVWMSFRNIPRVSIIRASDLNTYHVLWHRRVLFVDNAWDVLMTRLDDSVAAQPAAEEIAAS